MEDRPILDQQIEASYQRLHELTEQAHGLPEQRSVIAEALEALSTSLEELHVASEELRQQNDELEAARQAAEAERQRYQELFDFAPDGYLVTDAAGMIREANRAAAELLHMPPNRLVGRPLATYVAREDHEAFYARLPHLAQGERLVDWQMRLKPREAASFLATIAVAAARDSQGEVVGLRWQVRDISRREHEQSQREALLEALRLACDELEVRVQERTAELAQASAALKQERDFAAAVLDTVGALVIVLDQQGRIIRFNRACEQSTGYSFGEVKGRCFWDFLLIPAEVEPVRAAFDELRAGHLPSEFENYWVARDGSRRRIAWTNTAIPGPDGSIEYIISTGLDITERRQAEAVLRASEERFRSLYAMMTEGVALHEILYDAQGQALDYTLLDVNPAFETITGLSKERVLGRKASELYGTGQPPYLDVYAHVAASREPAKFETYFAPMGKHFEISAFSPTAGQFATVFADITERVRIEAERDATLEQLRAALAEKEVLMREIYHRVKNNVQALIYLMDMQAEHIPDVATRQMIRELQERARAMALVHEKLYQSRSLAQIDFGAYLRELVDNLSRAMGAGRPIVWDVNIESVPLGVDSAIPCGLVVSELLTNALKYAFPGGRPRAERGEAECKIRVEFRAAGDQLRLVVADNGVGLPPGLDWTTAPSMGLQLINILARHQLGAQVEVDSQAGTTFQITFTERRRM